MFARPPARFGGEKAGGLGEPSPVAPPHDQQKEGQAAALDPQPPEVQQLSDQKKESQAAASGSQPSEVRQLFPEIASSSGSVPSTRHWTRKELYTTEALEARERYTGLTLNVAATSSRLGSMMGASPLIGIWNVARRPFLRRPSLKPPGWGSDLLLATGSLEAAVNELQEMRLLRHGDLLAAAVNGQIEGVSRLHAEYLKEMAELGMPSRRVEAHNHGSVHGYEEELLGKA